MPIETILMLGGLFVGFIVLKKVMMGKTISGAEARALVEKGAVLVDVRSAGEFGGGHIKGAKNIPVGEIGARAGELPKEKTIVVYCRSGARSGQAKSILAAKGFADVHNLGPMSAW
jgi:rhodanese-related sulfurtransferase